ncbi:TVP38/TMEM64 family protein [Sphingomonas edaphi]|uniref:TVP38/TMEM64 family membrane protein n=1 Tax=Sphingomonas edaphi TaxID=2315689 RepID=A0A418PYH0_9SPHN|nr:VTT domain-containing protein [Sphingomonas edaphi]RIX27134.1 DedA family protein [Sphingomonas edaphi]
MHEFLLSAATFFENDVLVGLFFFAGTAIVISLWIPGFLLPIAASSGAVLDAWAGSTAVACGALVGSMAIFATSRRIGRDRLPSKLVDFIHRFEHQFRSHGAWCVFLLRLIGAPHFLVSAGSALMLIRARYFALATLAGMVPGILLAATAGSSLAA